MLEIQTKKNMTSQAETGLNIRTHVIPKCDRTRRSDFKHSLNIPAMNTPGIRPNASGAATVCPDGKQVVNNFITNLIIIIKICCILYIL